MRLLTILGTIAGIVGGLAALAFLWDWYQARREAATVRDEDDVLREGDGGPVEAWRATVLRAAIRWRDAVGQAAAVDPAPSWPWTIASARVFAEAATTEPLERLRSRARFVGVSSAVLDRVEREHPEQGAELRAALAALRDVVAATPLVIPPTVMRDATAVPIGSRLELVR